MFESDDYDQILSQIDFPEIAVKPTINNPTKLVSLPSPEPENNKTIVNNFKTPTELHKITQFKDVITIDKDNNENNSNNITRKESNSPKHKKRKIINSYFDHKTKRKFPGPAGLLNGSFETKKDETICEMEFLTQDIDYTQNYLHDDVFETPLWKRLLEDTSSLGEINCIKSIKHQALVGNLQRRKAQIVAAFIESVDRSAIDPLITLRDKTGSIKCTLHRDAWTAFSTYIVSESCALVLWRPTVLTTGSAFKKHYLNITLSNISGIYTSVTTSDVTLPDGFQKYCEEEYCVIKRDTIESPPDNEIEEENLDFLQDLHNLFADDMF